MICWIEGQRTPCAELFYRELNFGQYHDVSHLRIVRYRCALPLEELVAALEPAYREFAADDAAYGAEDEGPTISSMRAAGWPALAHLAKHSPALLRDLVREWFAFETVIRLFGAVENARNARYFINGVDDVVMEATTVALSGRALAR